ncbi:ABC transporter permease [Flammeovirgaceae bacterium SG7u.111]|nr:ABC transporter permease [Flammeovirgaceae bacterium SG7u.132]WPO33350.1 ABC transporter permease [Flammeovirgaceae bacterium SG7u.111]
MENRQNIPPKLATKFLLWFLRADLAEEVLGDLEERFYSKLKSASTSKAKIDYWRQVLQYFRPFALKKIYSFNSNFSTMFRHNILISFRNIMRHKTMFLINLVGLSSGLAGVILIYMWVNDELKMDGFHEKSERLYQFLEVQGHSGSVRSTKSTPWPLAQALKEEMPEVEYSAVVAPADWFGKLTLAVGEDYTKASGVYASKDYFNIFSYRLVYGNADQVLANKHSIVISEKLAYALFNTTKNVVGKTLLFQQENEFTISGIFENVPSNSSAKFDFVLSFELLMDQNPYSDSWKNSGPFTFVVLKEGADKETFVQKTKGLISTKCEDTHRALLLTSYADNYLHGKYVDGKQVGGRIEYVRIFSVVALFILAIACINFMNLSTARASRRAKEVGVKKAVGAGRYSLVFQYLTESILISMISLCLALLFVYLLLPQFNFIMGKQLLLFGDKKMFLAFFMIALFAGILAGSYPAFYLSGFKPISVLKGKIQTALSELLIRKGLVVFQFAMSFIFLVGVFVIYKQVDFVRTKNIGYNKENVVYFEIEGEIKQSREAFLTELKRIPGVVGASTAAQSMVGGGNTSNISWEGKDPDIRIPFAFRPADFGLMELLDLELVEGRFFSDAYADSLTVIFNEAGIKAMGMEDPIGKKIGLSRFDCEIVGVVKDFHFESLHSGVNPMFFILSPQYTEKVMVRLAGGKTSETLDKIEAFYKAFNPGFVFDFQFLDDDYQRQYANEKRVATLSFYFAVFAILISCLGLFGLVSFTAEQRTKEIGIRKILGASPFTIVVMITKDFLGLITIGFFIATPISWAVMQNWLEGFAYRIDIQWWLFGLTAALVLFIAFFTIGYQSLKASLANPVNSLRHE